MDRREFLKDLLLVAGGALVAGEGLKCQRYVALKGPVSLTLPKRGAGEVVIYQFPKTEDVAGVFRTVLDRVDDCAWYRPGDTVFIKLACNSYHSHPAVTSPEAVYGLVKELKRRGLKNIIVGDQSGIEHVRFRKGYRLSSTRKMMEKNGLLKAITESGAKAYFFEDQGWDSYVQTKKTTGNWGDHLYVAGIVQQVEHIINLPRLGAHALAGYTLGLKNGVGYLRDDSRLYLHQYGDTFLEKVAEISLVPEILSKLRLTLSFSSHALLDIGPDFGTKYRLPHPLVIASKSVIDHDAVAVPIMTYLHNQSRGFYRIIRPYPAYANYFNKRLVKGVWGKDPVGAYRDLKLCPYWQGIAYDKTLTQAFKVQGHYPAVIKIKTLGIPLDLALKTHVSAYWPGGFQF